MKTSFHKITVVLIVIIWSIYQFQSQTKVAGNISYESGSSKRTGNIVKGKNEGEWIWYYQNGKIQMKGNFVNGKREGIWKTYDTLGMISIESNYVNNKLEGNQFQYSTEGKVIKKVVFKNDQIVEK